MVWKNYLFYFLNEVSQNSNGKYNCFFFFKQSSCIVDNNKKVKMKIVKQRETEREKERGRDRVKWAKAERGKKRNWQKQNMMFIEAQN